MSDETIYRIGLEQENAELHRINTELNWVVQDLIAELRAEHWIYPEGDGWCQGCGEYQPCPSLRFANRAEARLREVQGER